MLSDCKGNKTVRIFSPGAGNLLSVEMKGGACYQREPLCVGSQSPEGFLVILPQGVHNGGLGGGEGSQTKALQAFGLGVQD